jgi:glucose-6-phosphate 1-dehydrogenase
MSAIRPSIIVIFGITGDLSRRKLLPALAEVIGENGLENSLRIVGITRKSNADIDKLLEKVPEPTSLRNSLELFSLAEGDVAGYEKLGKRLTAIEEELGQSCQRLFYLSVPPDAAQPAIDLLGSSGLSKIPDTKLLLEKPSGSNLQTAEELIKHIDSSFLPEQVYRIDHYLAKEFVRKFSADRKNEIIPKDSWNADHIDHLEILAAESIGIENRAEFYEETGAVRDLIQSHLLQVAALALMNTDSLDSETPDSEPAARCTALSLLHALPEESIRGQYDTYKEEVGALNSSTETFASIVVISDDPRWKDMPITLTTGKALDKKQTCIKVTYKDSSIDDMIILLSPENGSAHHDAYYQVFLDALEGKREVFVSSDETLECWRIVDSVREYWKEHHSPLISYAKGSTVEEVLSKKSHSAPSE